MSSVPGHMLNHIAEEQEWVRRAIAGDAEYLDYYHTFDDRALPDAYEQSLPEIFPEVLVSEYAASSAEPDQVCARSASSRSSLSARRMRRLHLGLMMCCMTDLLTLCLAGDLTRTGLLGFPESGRSRPG
jgi:hypothetical protein